MDTFNEIQKVNLEIKHFQAMSLQCLGFRDDALDLSCSNHSKLKIDLFDRRYNKLLSRLR